MDLKPVIQSEVSQNEKNKYCILIHIWGRQRIRWLDASLTQWTWGGVNSRSWWWTGRPGMLQSMGSQRVGHDWDWTDWIHIYGIWKNGTDEAICRAGTETQTQRPDLWTAGEGEGGRNWEQQWNMYISVCQTDSYREAAVPAGSSACCPVTAKKGGVGDGRVSRRGHVYAYGWFRNQHNAVKQSSCN